MPAVRKGGHVSPQLSVPEVLGAHVQEELVLQQHVNPSGTQPRADTHSCVSSRLAPGHVAQDRALVPPLGLGLQCDGHHLTARADHLHLVDQGAVAKQRQAGRARRTRLNWTQGIGPTKDTLQHITGLPGSNESSNAWSRPSCPLQGHLQLPQCQPVHLLSCQTGQHLGETRLLHRGVGPDLPQQLSSVENLQPQGNLGGAPTPGLQQPAEEQQKMQGVLCVAEREEGNTAHAQLGGAFHGQDGTEGLCSQGSVPQERPPDLP